MTISYNSAMSSVSALSFLKLMGRWKGSIWKAVLPELIVWLILYYIVFCIYRFLLTEDQQKYFEYLAEYLDHRLSYIPLTFMLGFFVSSVMGRWKSLFHSLGHIEDSALTLACLFTSDDPQYRLHRRSIIRYLVLSQILLLREISMRVKRRFPNLESLVESGFLMENEARMLEQVSTAETYGNYFVPINWSISLLKDLWRNNVFEPLQLNYLFTEMRTFRAHLHDLLHHDEIPVPLAYPQVVFLATRVHFLICLISRQHFVQHEPITEHHYINILFPFMTVFQFIFFIGWMKVAEALLNPLGEDDDDYETNYLIDKNIAVGMAIVDETFNQRPDLREDIFSDPDYVPMYSEQSMAYNGKGFDMMGSARAMSLAPEGNKINMISVNRGANTKGLSPNLRRRVGDIIRNSKNQYDPNQRDGMGQVPTIAVTRAGSAQGHGYGPAQGNKPNISHVHIQEGKQQFRDTHIHY